MKDLKDIVKENRISNSESCEASPGPHVPLPPYERSRDTLLRNIAKLKSLGENDNALIETLQVSCIFVEIETLTGFL